MKLNDFNPRRHVIYNDNTGIINRGNVCKRFKTLAENGIAFTEDFRVFFKWHGKIMNETFKFTKTFTHEGDTVVTLIYDNEIVLDLINEYDYDKICDIIGKYLYNVYSIRCASIV